MSWVTARDKDKYGVAIENYQGEDEMCLSLTVGDTVHVLEVCGMDWAYGYITHNLDMKGIFPRAYIQNKDCRLDRSGPVERVIPKLPPVIQELTASLREWRSLLRQCFRDCRHEYHKADQNMKELIDLRKKILSNKLPLDELKRLKQEVTQKIDLVNRLLGLDLVVRDDAGNILNTLITSTTTLFRRHKQTDELLEKAQGGADEANGNRRKLHSAWTAHIHFTNIIVKVPCLCEISVALYKSEAEGRWRMLTEPYVFHWSPSGYTDDNDLYDKLQCMYTDLSSNLITAGGLWLVGVVVQEGRPVHTAAERRVSTTSSFLPSRKIGTTPTTDALPPDNLRRAFGVFALDVSEMILHQMSLFSPTAAATLNTSQPEEGRAKFTMCGEKECLESVVKRLLGQTGEGKPSDESVFCTLALQNGDIKTLRSEHPHYLPFKEVVVAPRLHLAEVIVPGYVRNDLYVTLLGAEISKGNKMNDKNVEVTVTAYDSDNKLLTGVLSSGVGRSSLKEYRTVTYHHEGRPRWLETVKIAIPIHQFKGAHLRFLFRHRSMNEGKDKQPRAFAIAFAHLMQSNGTTLNNVDHELYLYNLDYKKWRDDDFEYLRLPWLRGQGTESASKMSCSGLTLASKDTFSISTIFCSTKLTQNVHLLKLLEWSDRLSRGGGSLLTNGDAETNLVNGGSTTSNTVAVQHGASTTTDAVPVQDVETELKQCLSQLRLVEREELVIFLQDTLDVLLHLLIKAPDKNRLDEAVFEALVDVVYIAGEQHKGETVQPVLNSYIDSNFSAAMVYSKLIYLLKDYVDRAASIVPSRRNSFRIRTPAELTASSCSLERVDAASRFDDSLSLSESDRISSDVITSNGGADFSSPNGREFSKMLNKTLKCLPYLIKFIVKSRQLYAQYYVQGHEEFGKALEGLFVSLAGLMKNNANDVVSAQGQCLRYIPATIPDVITVFDPVKLSKLLIQLLTNLSPNQLTPQKLNTIGQICHSTLFLLPDCRELLLRSFVDQLKTLLDRSLEMAQTGQATRVEKSVNKVKNLFGDSASDPGLDKELSKIKTLQNIRLMEVSKVVEILEDIVCVLHAQHATIVTQHHMRFLTDSLLQQILMLAWKTPHTEPLAARYMCVLMGLVRQVDDGHLHTFVRDNSEVVVSELVIAIKNFVENPVFKQDWAQMTLLFNNILLTLLRVCAMVISDKMRDPFKRDIWNNWFQCSIKFITQPALQLEKFLPSKRNKIRALYQDMRKIAANEVKKMWYELGQHKLSFIVRAGSYCLVAPMLEMTLIPEPELRNTTIPIFFDMMQCEFYSPRNQPANQSPVMGSKDLTPKMNFDDFENEMLVNVDEYVGSGSGYGDDHYCNVFSSILGNMASQHTTLKEPGKKFVQTISSQLKCLLQYRSILDSPGHSIETRMCCTAHLLDFYSAFSNKELYVRYVNKLVHLHIRSNNLTEAGFALYEHAKILKWDHAGLPAALKSPRHSVLRYHNDLKEKLYEDIINYMEEGQMWECALERCKELRVHYESTVMDYEKLAALLERMARCYKAIMDPNAVRPEPEYFRVAYYGRGFPGFLQNKIFVHRGNGFERLSDFQTRLLDQFPNAELLTKLTPPEEEKQESPEQYVQVNKVECVVDANQFTKPGVSEEIRRFYRANDIKQFTYARPFHEGTRVKDNEFATLCVEKTTLHISHSLPGILRCFRVVKQSTVKLSPLENAIETMRTNNADLRDLVQSHDLRGDLALDSLTRKLSGMIDAAVMGGVANYEKAFLHDEYINDHPDALPKIEELKRLIKQMVPLLEQGLMVHADRVSAQITDLHDHMLKQFDKMKKLLTSKYGEMPHSDLTIKRRSLRPLRQKSIDATTGTRSSHYAGSNESLGQSSQQQQRLSVGGGYSTLQRNKLSTTSLPIQSKSKFRALLRRESYTSKEGQSLFYDTSGLQSSQQQQPIIEISETLVTERPARSEADDRRYSRPNSQLSITTTTSSTPTPSNSGSFESLSIFESEITASDVEMPPPLPVKTRTLLDPDRNSYRLNTLSFSGDQDQRIDSNQAPPEKPPRPS